MKLHIALAAALAVAAGPALAQAVSPHRNGFTPDSPYASQVRRPSPSLESAYGAAPAGAATTQRPSTHAAPPATGFQPYKPFTGSSVYGQPKRGATGAKPCETSVYVNACGR